MLIKWLFVRPPSTKHEEKSTFTTIEIMLHLHCTIYTSFFSFRFSLIYPKLQGHKKYYYNIVYINISYAHTIYYDTTSSYLQVNSLSLDYVLDSIKKLHFLTKNWSSLIIWYFCIKVCETLNMDNNKITFAVT